MSYFLGLDIGTSWTAAAVWQAGRAGTLPLGERADAVPSAVFLRDDGTFVVGETALRLGVIEPTRLAREFKPRLGDAVPVVLGGRGVPTELLTGTLIRWAVQRATEVMGGPPQATCLAVPATWGRHRQDCMRLAARHGGLAEVDLVAEPVAAAGHHAVRQGVPIGARVAVFDLGGGTFDAVLLRRTGDGFIPCGDPIGLDDVGGIYFDDVVLELVRRTVGPGFDLIDDRIADPVVLSGLRTAVTEAKEALSAETETTLTLVLPDGDSQSSRTGSPGGTLTRTGVTRTHVVRLTRGEFETAIRPAVQRTVEAFTALLRRQRVEPDELEAVLTIGGSSRVPLVRGLLGGTLGVPLRADADPSHAVCLGAAMTAAGVTRLTEVPAEAPVERPDERPVEDTVPRPSIPVDGRALPVDPRRRGIVLAEQRRAARRASGANTLSQELTRTLVLAAAFALVVLALFSLSGARSPRFGPVDTPATITSVAPGTGLRAGP